MGISTIFWDSSDGYEREESLVMELVFNQSALDTLTDNQRSILRSLMEEGGSSYSPDSVAEVTLTFPFFVQYRNIVDRFEAIMALIENPNVKFSRADLNEMECLFVNFVDSIREVRARLETR